MLLFQTLRPSGLTSQILDLKDICNLIETLCLPPLEESIGFSFSLRCHLLLSVRFDSLLEFCATPSLQVTE